MIQKNRNTTANKENKDVIMSKSSSSDSSSPSTMMAKVKKERVSLVQRQTRFAANVQQNTNTHRPLTRSATTPALPGRGRTTTSKVTSSTKPKLPEASNKSINGALPFGSTSSISSSSSNRSWADTVKGLKTPRSVENLKALTQDEEGGWETVKTRTRSRFSPGSRTSSKSSITASVNENESSKTNRTPLRATKSASALPRNHRHQHKTPPVVLEKVVEAEKPTIESKNIETKTHY